MRRSRLRVIGAAGSLMLAGAAAAQETPSPPAAADGPLAGPRVEEAKGPPTLVERDMAGKVRRLEIPPGEAALGLLTLDEATRSRTQAILTERAAILDRIVLDNLELIIQIHNASEAGDKPAAIQLLGQALQKLRPLRDRGPVEAELAAALPDPLRREYWRLVKEYQTAILRELMDEAKARGEDARPLAATIKSSLIVLGGEIKRSYERQVAGKAAEFEKVLKKLDLTPEQDGKVRGLVARFAEQTRGKPTESQKRNLFLAVMANLNLEQQKLLIRYTLGGESPD